MSELLTPMQAARVAGVSYPTHFGENRNIEFRAEAFNVSNTAPLGAPNAVLGAAGFGSITSAGDPRVLQFGVKLNFQDCNTNDTEFEYAKWYIKGHKSHFPRSFVQGGGNVEGVFFPLLCGPV